MRHRPAEAAGSSPTRPAPPRTALATAAAVAAALAVAAVVLVASGGFRTADSDETTLRGFQIRVLSISQAAAENRMDGALAALQALEADLDSAARDGRISAPRLRGIELALASVRADITGHLTSQAALAGTTAVPAPAEAVAAETVPLPETIQPEQPEAGEGVEVIVPPPVPAQQEQGAGVPDAAKENKGKGKGNGKP
ncbi:hypothetical protein FDW83_02100 [Pseudarthrobacter sp. NamE2]|uniref:hypothetical protein n=1 Tax=Pseudarthrobacter sp. NamE2 TaxID=2576838 RepID=UPI0010FEA781|nr:hypothetical protein [Pseudarthrobacter sp. NamE2]TLM86558.1 hypothetical protein FDW83_02100 [Pseudarthrobacter sp. NamE2]